MRYGIFLALFLIGCDNSTSTQNPPENPAIPISRTIRDTVIVRERVYSPKTTIYKNTKKYVNSQIVQGTILDKNTRANNLGVVVCSEVMNKCVRTNSDGIYRLENVKIAGRSVSDDVIDTVQTPENISVQLPSDTMRLDTTEPQMGVVKDTNTFTEIKVVNNDTLIVDSIVISDIITLIDTVEQVITVPDTMKVKDTLSYIQDGTILGEIPITSWGFILGVNYIVQRNISVVNGVGGVTNVEAVYFLTGDSLAKVVTLGNNGSYFSGFIYTLYNDSSFRYDKRIYNLFVRGKDSTGKVITKTDVESFSEKFGDFQQKTLSEKMYTPQYLIDPVSFVPNNADIPGFSENFVDTVSKRNWLSSKEFLVSLDSNAMDDEGSILNYKDLSKYDLSEVWIVYNSGILGADSVTFDLTVDADSICDFYTLDRTTYTNIQRNVKTHFAYTIMTRGQTTIGIKIATKEYARIKVENIRLWF